MQEGQPINAQQAIQKPSTEFSQALKQEMALTAETMNEPLSELKILGYLEALSGMRTDQIHMGFRRARRTLKWFPKPSEIRELSAIEAESLPKQNGLSEKNYVPMTAEDRAACREQLNAVIKKLGNPFRRSLE